AIKQGFFPKTISTDLHTGSMNTSMKSQIDVMSKFLFMGMPLNEVIKASTWAPAQVIKHEELGNLSVGAMADVAVLNLRECNFGILVVAIECNTPKQTTGSRQLYESSGLTRLNSFTSGAEGPAVNNDGNLYAVNYSKEGTIGKITPTGDASVFIELTNGSIGNGIRFNSKGEMLIADYTNHNILKVDMVSKQISVYAHDSM